MMNFARSIFMTLGGGLGWLLGKFEPTFPLVVVMIVFVLYDAWTAFQLDKRVHLAYPDRAKRREAKFTSFAFGKVVRSTIPKRLALIMLAFAVDEWVWPIHNLYVAHLVTGVICFEQAWSILENECSCRDESEDTRLWRVLRAILVDKTQRHLEKLDVHVDIEEIMKSPTPTLPGEGGGVNGTAINETTKPLNNEITK